MLPGAVGCSFGMVIDMRFNGHPPLGVNATPAVRAREDAEGDRSFNGHPPLGVNATNERTPGAFSVIREFQWAPTLGGECYCRFYCSGQRREIRHRFNGHPPLGVNATRAYELFRVERFILFLEEFQWAPTLGGECYSDQELKRLCLCDR